MYDVMIIDDDQFIRERLKSMIEWDELGIRLVCEAQDSETSRELFLLHHPKIIITDINIPIISGLELAREIAAIDPEVQFIIITGYTDFEYAKETIKLGAADLISKPILPADINASLKKVVMYFEKMKSEQIASLNMSLLLEENLPMLREKFIYYISESERSYSHEEILGKLRILSIDLYGKWYAIVLISPDISSLTPSETDMILVAVKNTSDEILLNAGFKSYSFYDNNYRLNCLLGWDFNNGNFVLEETVINISEKIRFYWNIIVHAGIGMPVTDLTKLYATFHESSIALNYQEMIENCPVVNYKNVKRLDMPVTNGKSEVIAQAVACFDSNNLKQMNQLIKNELSAILTSQKDYMPAARKFLFEFISPIIAESITRGIRTESIMKWSVIYEKIFSTENIPFLTQYVMDFVEVISAELFQKRSESKNALIKMAKDFITNNLGNENLNLDMVSRHIGLSSIYFCKLFHKEEGISFNNHLNLVRVSKAKLLLTETSLKVFEVGCETGYGNSKYFNYIFKRIAGMTPLEYRNNGI